MSRRQAPSPNGGLSSADRDSRGRFTPGNAGGPGNPLGGKVARLRAALIEAVSEDDIRAIAHGLIEQAKDGDIAAAKELLNRTLGKPTEHDLIERLEALEGIAAKREGWR